MKIFIGLLRETFSICKATKFFYYYTLNCKGLPQSYGPKGWPKTNFGLICPNACIPLTLQKQISYLS